MQPNLGHFSPLLAWMGSISRRRVLSWAVVGIAASGAGCRSRDREGLAEAGAPRSPGHVLGAGEWETLAALVARILPSDDGPGAREANVVGFVDAQLATKELAPVAPVILEAARRLETIARDRFARSFAALEVAEQDSLAHAMSRGELFAPPFPGREVFAALHTLTLEGFLSDPLHGGNAGQIGWHYVDFAEPTLRTPGGAHHHPLPVVK
jgi:gluconate 2-dehydrogenase gamma chain